MANDILERLRHRVDVFSKSESKTEFGEITYSYKIHKPYGQKLHHVQVEKIALMVTLYKQI